MQLNVAGLRVIVTAGARGIGRAITEMFLENGAQVHICDISPEALPQCQEELPQLGGTVADVSEPEQVDAMFAAAMAQMGGLDVLVNNAGIAGPTGRVEEIDPAGWERTMAVNINGQFYCARRAIPLLKEAGGSIVNISTTAGLFGYPLRSPYAASKWAVIGFTKTLAMELGEFGIRANAICPGSIDGARMDRVINAEAAAKGIAPQSVRQAYLRQVSMQTFIDAREIANMVLFITSPLGSKISGQALSVDGHTETMRT